MNQRFVWELSVTISPDAEEAVGELFARVFGRPAAVCTDLNTRTSTVSTYASNRRFFAERRVRAIKTGLKEIAQCNLEIGPARIRVRRLRQRNWAVAWKKQFKPVRVGSALLIKPSWSRIKPRKGELAIVLDPGLAFGTGHHPTTVFCLEQLIRLRKPGTRQSMLDIGTGSGILAVAAAKLGYEPVVAFDCDPNAVRVAKANVKRNRLVHKVRIQKADLANFAPANRTKFDVVCANLNGELLLRYTSRVRSFTVLGGALALAGILRAEFGDVQRAYRKAGFKLVKTNTEQEWQSGLFVFNAAKPRKRK
jgi:ribosomal protein L11 methyltransferase